MPVGSARESGGVSVFLAEAVPGVFRGSVSKLAGLHGLLSVPAELSVPECVRAGRTDLTCSLRPRFASKARRENLSDGWTILIFYKLR